MRRELLYQLDLEAVRGTVSDGISTVTSTELGVNTNDTTKGTVQKRKINSERYPIIILARDAILIKQCLNAELSNGLDAITIEEVMEKIYMVSRKVEVADLSHFVKSWKEPLIQEVDTIVC